MDIYLHNTISGDKEIFKPLIEGKVKMYSCGPTVYSEQHIGNMRAAVFSDTLARMFAFNGYKVDRVTNITDVGHLTGDNDGDADTGDDRMEKEAKAKGKMVNDIAKEVTKMFLNDLTELNIDVSDITFPHATQYIEEQIIFIKTLEQKGYTYKTSDGIYFDTSLFKNYGKLGNINIKNLKEGARIQKNSEKRNPSDFALWKFSRKEDKRQQEWSSPWGVGFPGWHIECSAMSRAILGARIDVHTGGIEHIPVHHNNEIAQSEALSGKRFANYWVHNAHLMLNGKKISKSLGNVVYLRQIKDKGYDPLALRYLFLSANYDSEQNFTWEALDAANNALKKLRKYVSSNLDNGGIVNEDFKADFTSHINNNLNTPKALALLWDMQKSKTLNSADKVATILDFDRVLGLKLSLGKADAERLGKVPVEVVKLLDLRKKAREEKNWAKSDELRDKIRKLGYEIIDNDNQQKLKALIN